MVYIIVEGSTDKALIKNILSDKTERTDFEFLGLKGIDSVKKTLTALTEHELSQISILQSLTQMHLLKLEIQK